MSNPYRHYTSNTILTRLTAYTNPAPSVTEVTQALTAKKHSPIARGLLRTALAPKKPT